MKYIYSAFTKKCKMKLAVIGSRDLTIQNLKDYIPPNVSEIVSGGAVGIDTVAADYAKKNEIHLKEFLPQYEKYKRGAPLIRNKQIAEYADEALVFWNGHSKGTQYTIESFYRLGKKVTIIII